MKKLFSLLTALALSLALALSVAAAGTPTIVAKADNDALKRKVLEDFVLVRKSKP